jgi:hypothetical protein
MNRMLNKLRLSRPQWQIVRLGLSVGLILAVLYLVQAGLTLIAVLLVLASKWQIIRGGPRLWIHNFWDNIVDIIFVLAVIALLEVYSGTNISLLQLGIVGLYLAWQILIKPHAGVLGHSIQALLTMALAISVIFLMKSPIGIAGMIILAWIVAAAAADHFLITVTDDTSLRKLLSLIWALVVAQAVWLLGHWLVFYPFWGGRVLFPQAMLVIVAMGYIFGIIYFDHHQKRLSRKRLYSYLSLMAVIILVLITGSEWVSRV